MEKLLPKNKYMLALAALIAISYFILNAYELIIFRFLNSYDIDSKRAIECTQSVFIALSACLAFQSYRTRFRILIAERILLFVFDLMKRWLFSFCNSLIKDNGYLVFFSILGIYVTVYTLVEAKATIDSTSLAVKKTNFISLVSSGNNLSFKYAMALLPDLYTLEIVSEPYFFNPASWLKTEVFATHNELHQWMDSYLSSCTVEKCGNEKYRIDVSGLIVSGVVFSNVNFINSDFRNVGFYDNRVYGCDFTNSNMDELIISHSIINPESYGTNSGGERSLFLGVSMRGVKIINSDLSASDFSNSDMSPAHLGYSGETKIEQSVLKYTSFKGANLEGVRFVDVDIRGADFSGANLENATFNDVLYDEFTQFPEGFDLNRVKN